MSDNATSPDDKSPNGSGKSEGGPSFDAILHPHRSLPPAGFAVLMAALAGTSFIAGLVFVSMGAWPVFGFFGLDVALLYLAFRLNYRSGRLYERVQLTPQRLTLTRVHPSGRHEVFEFNPYWVRVELKELPSERTVLALALGRNQWVFGRFLTDDERRDFATHLTAALISARSAGLTG
jgi:uncharacterized membrane protein